jgi:hypothetical protein
MDVSNGASALTDLDELSVKQMLCDSIVHAVMRADGVHVADLAALLRSVANSIRGEAGAS